MSALEALMDLLEVQYDQDRHGNQSVLCPWHPDRSPSASLRLDEGLFYCFTCGIGGDVIALLMKTEGLTYASAVKRQEELAGDADGQVSRRPSRRSGDSLLPRRSGHRPGRRGWRSPWGRE